MKSSLTAQQQGLTVWCTGLSGSGKTTICRAVHAELVASGRRVELLDGDVVRKQFSPDLGFSKKDRDENVRRIALMAQLLARHGVLVLVSAISPYRLTRDQIRDMIGNFIEVYVNAPLKVCEQRDPKGLYELARNKKLSGFTGIDDPYEPPLSPEIECRTDQETPKESADKVLSLVFDLLNRNNHNGNEFHRKNTFHKVTPENRQRTIAVDFDGVIANYDGWKGTECFGLPRADVVDALRILRDEGWKIVVHTTRGSQEITPYLIDQNIPFDEINSNSSYATRGTKPVATVYWDDRAFRYSGDARIDLRTIRQFRTWNGRE